MKDKIEAKIQEEIRRRVLEQDEAIRRKQELEMDRDANREALADLTSLSRRNVDDIAKQVRDEFARKKRRFKKVVLMGAFICVAVIAYLYFSGPSSDPKSQRQHINFTESFVNNRNHWPTGESYDFKRNLRDGRYICTNANLGYCSWDAIPVKLPPNYEIELTSTWLEGKYDEYGFMLIHKTPLTSFHNIQINGDGSARFSTMINNKWITSDDWLASKAHQGDGETSNTQRFKLVNGEYEHRVNDLLVGRGRFENTATIGHIALRVCGQQTVAFEHLTIRSLQNADKPEILLDDSFDAAESGWTPKDKLKTRRYFENDQYIYQTHKKNRCFFTGIDMRLTDNYEVQLKSIWQKGEQENYGLVLARDFNQFLAFQLQNKGYASYAWYVNHKYEKESQIIKAGRPGDGKIANIHRVRVQNGRFEYWVNNKLVFSDLMPDMPIKKVGVRVCGRQTVAFDHLMVKSINGDRQK